MKRVILSIAAIALVCQVAGAQNLLRNLGNKAINKATNSVEKKVEKKVDNAIDKQVDKALEGIFGKKQEQPQQQETTVYNEEPSYSFAGSLMYEDRNIDNFADAPSKATLSINSYSDLVKYRPAWPTSADLANRAAFEKYAEKVQEYSLAAAELITADMTMKGLIALGQQDNPVDKGVHSTKASAIAEELVKISEDRGAKVQAQNQSLADGLRAALKGQNVPNTTTIAGAMEGLKQQIVADWNKSAEFKKVNSLEESGKAKLARVKDQSAVIDTWNKAQLEKWVAALKNWEKENCANVARVIELDAQLEALPEKEKKSAEYKIAKGHANGMSAMIMQWVMIPSEIFACPYVEYPRTEEDY